MTIRAELERVGEVLARATAGEWRWSENGNILGDMPNGYDEEREVGAIYTDDDATGAPNAPAIIAAINFLRDKVPALLAAIDRAEADRARLDYIERTFSGMTNRERYLPVQMIWGKGCNGRTLREACDKYMQRDTDKALGAREVE